MCTLAENHCPGISVPVDYQCIKCSSIAINIISLTVSHWLRDGHSVTKHLLPDSQALCPQRYEETSEFHGLIADRHREGDGKQKRVVG